MIELRECPICGRSFYPAPQHTWKIKTRSSKGGWAESKIVCSYTCMRAGEKEYEAKPNERKARKV